MNLLSKRKKMNVSFSWSIVNSKEVIPLILSLEEAELVTMNNGSTTTR